MLNLGAIIQDRDDAEFGSERNLGTEHWLRDSDGEFGDDAEFRDDAKLGDHVLV